LLALLAAWGVARLAWARLGGLNGDALGAMIALGEVVLLLAQALLGPAPSSRAGPGLP
ncbi:adenosylcobinamide-GDP ribazoletransferase, partial [Thermus scotoductus]